LIVTYGNTPRKVRTLDRGVLMLGQAAGCDLQLKSIDVFPVHALLVRAAEGWRVRDVTGRGATRLNGQSIQDEPLQHGDVIQIGTFSFQLHLPQENEAVDEDGFAPADLTADDEPGDVDHLRRSRVKLGRMAWNLRQRLTECRNLLAERERQQQTLQHDLDNLLSELKARAQQLRQAQAELAECRAAQSAQEPVASSPDPEAAYRLDVRARELGQYASHLKRWHQRLVSAVPGDEVRDLRGRLEQMEHRCRAAEAAGQRDLGRLQTLANSLRAERDRLHEQRTSWQFEQETWQSERGAVQARQEELQATAQRLRDELDRRTAEADLLRNQLGHLSLVRQQLQGDQALLTEQEAEAAVCTQNLDRARRELEALLAPRAAVAYGPSHLARYETDFPVRAVAERPATGCPAAAEGD
jgi:hypothetical protein